MLHPIIADMKDKLMDTEVQSFNWIETKMMIADILTKEKAGSRQFEEVLSRNIYDGINVNRNKVMYTGSEVKLIKS